MSQLFLQNVLSIVKHKLRNYTIDLRLVQQFGLWSSRSWPTVTMSKAYRSLSYSKVSAAVVFTCAILPSSRRRG